jgi:hypothetical protein
LVALQIDSSDRGATQSLANDADWRDATSDPLPQRSYFAFSKHWMRAEVIQKVERTQIGFGAGIIGDGYAAAASIRAVAAVLSAGAVSPVAAAGRAGTAGASAAAPAAFSARATGAAETFNSKSAALGIDEKEILGVSGRDAYLQQWMV